MIDTTEAPQTPTVPVQDFPEVVLPDPGSTEEETVLVAEITALWLQHEDIRSALKNSKGEASKVREELGQRFTQIKEVLARPGRNGEWSAWLKKQQIPRATADRLVAKHERSLNPDVNCLTESTSDIGGEKVEKLVHKISSQLRRVFSSPASLYDFVVLLTSDLGLERTETNEGILIARPTFTAPQIATASVEISDAEIGHSAESSIPQAGVRLQIATEQFSVEAGANSVLVSSS